MFAREETKSVYKKQENWKLLIWVESLVKFISLKGPAQTLGVFLYQQSLSHILFVVEIIRSLAQNGLL